MPKHFPLEVNEKLKVYILRVTNSIIINYCYLIVNTKQNTGLLVDPAWELTTIENLIDVCQVKIHGILLTHHHFDHVNLASDLTFKYNVPVFMSHTEIHYYGFKCYNLRAIIDFEPFQLGNIQIVPISTPGHTKGGTSYLIGNNLFCGDTLFIEGCGICTGNGGNVVDLFNTLQFFKGNIPARTTIYPGHSYGKLPGLPFEHLLTNNIYLQFDKLEDFASYRLRKNQKNLFDFK